MRICYLADAESIHVQRWADYFAQRGHEVHLISFKHSNIHNTIPHFLRRLPFRLEVVSLLLNSLPVFFQIKRLLQKIKPDIIHAHYVWEYGIAGALTRFQPFVISAWGSDVLTLVLLLHSHFQRF